MIKSLSLGLMLGGILLFVAFIYFSFVNYQKRFNLKYSMRNVFPYELNYKGRFKDNLAGNICLTLSSICLLVFFSTFLKHYDNGFFLASMISGIIFSLATLLIFFIPFELLKFHIILDLALFMGALCVNGTLATGAFFQIYELFNVYSLIAAIITSILTVFVFILIMNPKLSHWADLSPEKNKDGTMSFKRPKYFVLAYSEWALVLVAYLTTIPTFILMYSL